MEDTELTDEPNARLGFFEDALVLGVGSWTGAVSTSISKGGVSSLKSGSTNSFLAGVQLLGRGDPMPSGTETQGNSRLGGGVPLAVRRAMVLRTGVGRPAVDKAERLEELSSSLLSKVPSLSLAPLGRPGRRHFLVPLVPSLLSREENVHLGGARHCICIGSGPRFASAMTKAQYAVAQHQKPELLGVLVVLLVSGEVPGIGEEGYIASVHCEGAQSLRV
ncbi:hypothetical protein B0H14DRAFT_2564328 [Mycena olivaceomarginata]|nr:hypothetical protein B0H14DRAFT_2564328 [Mycena olivaceomarginata]